MRFRDIRFRSKLLLLIGLFVIGFATVFSVGAVTLARVKVTEKTYGADRISGNLYQEVVLAEDLVADTLPPPAYVVESYLALHQIHELTDVAKIREKVEYFKARETEFDDRQRFWDKELPTEGELRSLMLDQSRKPAKEFYRLCGQFLDKADKIEEREAVWTELLPQIHEQYEVHRLAIDKITKLSNKMAEDAQAKAG